jgi:Tol biopolymer transport system component
MLLFLRGPEKHGPNGSVWLAAADGGNTKMIVVSDGGIEGAAWLPDGKGIAVSSYRDLRHSIVRINLDDTQSQGNQPHRIVGDARTNWYDPSVSPDGKHLISITDYTRLYWNFDSKCAGFAIVPMDIHTNKSETLAAGVNYSVVWERK